MKQHNVDFIGGDFNMSAFFTVGDVLWIQSFQHLAIRFCGDLLRWKTRIVCVLDFSPCQSVHTTGVWIHTAATSTTTPSLALDPVTKQLTFLFSLESKGVSIGETIWSSLLDKGTRSKECAETETDKTSVHMGAQTVTQRVSSQKLR